MPDGHVTGLAVSGSGSLCCQSLPNICSSYILVFDGFRYVTAVPAIYSAGIVFAVSIEETCQMRWRVLTHAVGMYVAI